MTVDVEPEVVLKPHFDPKQCAAEGCTNIFTPTIGVQKFCPKHSTNKESKRRSRKYAAEKAARKVERANAITAEEFWQQNRKRLTKQQLATFAERQEQVFDTLHWMNAWLEDRYNVSPDDELHYVGLEEGTDDLMPDIKEHGTCDTALVFTDFWKPSMRDFYDAVVAEGGATATFVKFGFITAIPIHKLLDHGYGVAWHNKFGYRAKDLGLKSHTIRTPIEWVTSRCPTCKQLLPALPKEVKPVCPYCLASRAQSTLGNAGQERSKIFDSYGRVDHWRKEEA